MEPFDPDLLWIVIISFAVAFILSFGIGANDVANSFGTSVGSKVITIKSACIVATIFEITGAVLIGYKVSDTMRKVIMENLYDGAEKELMFGYLSALGGSGIWMIVATFLNLPISGTHSIVGATLGFSLISRGFNGLHWKTFIGIICSWFISPVFSGFISVILFLIIGYFILNSSQPIKNGLRILPMFYGITVAINVFSVIHGGSKMLYLHNVKLWVAIMCSSIAGIFTGLIVYLFVVPRQHVKIITSLPGCKKDTSSYLDDSEVQYYKMKKYTKNEPKLEPELPKICTELNHISGEGSVKNLHSDEMSGPKFSTSQNGINGSSCHIPLVADQLLTVPNASNEDFKHEFSSTESVTDNRSVQSSKVETIFSFLQILTAIFGSFAHGGNDVSNAIGPLVGIWLIYSEGTSFTKNETPFFILLFGGIGISVGLCLWGRRVIKTIGEDLTKITPSTGFSIEIGAAMTVLLASKIGVPISTTHCKVGSVVFVGCFSSSKEAVDWKLFRNIVYAWVITVPVAALLSAVIMFGLTKTLL